MSTLAFQILQILLNAPSPCPASWNIAEALSRENGREYAYEFHWKYPESPLDYAMKELMDKGLVEEMPDLGSRFRIIYIPDH